MNYNTLSDSSVIESFSQAMQSAGIHYSGEIIADGRLHRFHIEGHRRGSLNGAYRLHPDGCPAGWFKDHKSGIYQTWRSSQGYRPVSYELNRQIKEARQQQKEDLLQKHADAALKAKYVLSKSTPITRQEDHPYLISKRIQPHSAKINRDSLVIPIKDESKTIVNLQFISPEGEKKFLSGGKKKGCFHPIGQPTPRILITEGFATGASLHESTGQCVIVAFDAGNLSPVAKVISTMLPDSEIIIAGDNDLSGVGQTKAKKAAIAIGAKVLIPPVTGKDWNDLIAGGSQHG